MSRNNLTDLVLDCFLKLDFSRYTIFGQSNSIFESLAIIYQNLQKCPICLSYPKNPCRSNKCAHIFCYKCLRKWFKIRKTCPLCRKRFSKINSIRK